VVGLAAWSPTQELSLAASAGGVLRRTSVYRDAASISQGSGFVWGAGASYRVLDDLSVTGELFGEIARSGRSELGMNKLALAPVEALVGATYRADAWSFGAALGHGLTDGIGAPALRGIVTMSYTVGVPRPEPLRPRVAPSPGPDARADRDRDGIPDARDRCPDQPEDKDGFEDDDGCPDLDNDGDGIPDARDRCPDEPEDRDGFEDSDGCPDLDNDRDGIPDARDKCPNEPETVNGKDDDDGCPDELDPVAADPRATIKAAEETFKRGLQLMQQRQYSEACAAFEQSQRLDPQFGTQYQIAGCFQKVGKLATAWNMYRELSRSDSNPTRRPKAGKIAAALAPRVPRIRLVLRKPVPGIQVLMNGVNAGALIGVDTPVDFGSYAFVATAPDHREWRKAVDIKEEGKIVTVVIELGP